MKSDLPGCVVWLTGASSGIGEAVAEELLRRGARVALTARREDALTRIAAGRETAMVETGDTTDLESMKGVAERVRGRWGHIDIALLNAGTYTPVTPGAFTAEIVRRHVEVNVMGTANCIEAVLPDMLLRRAGRIAVVSSATAFTALPLATAYGASKAFLLSMSDSLRADLAGERTGVKVTVVAPGFVNTSLTEQNDFKMPFVIEADEAARIIADGLAAGDDEIAFPRPMALSLRGLAILPGPVRRAYVARVSGRRARDRARG